MKLSRVAAAFDHPDFVFELKHDGFRCLAYISESRCDLVSSRNNNHYKSFDSLKTDLAKLKVENAILDGEIVCLDSEGKSRFNLLFRRRSRGRQFHRLKSHYRLSVLPEQFSGNRNSCSDCYSVMKPGRNGSQRCTQGIETRHASTRIQSPDGQTQPPHGRASSARFAGGAQFNFTGFTKMVQITGQHYDLPSTVFPGASAHRSAA